MTEWLTGTLLSTSVLMALVLLAREPVRKAFGPAVTYGLWLIPALRMLMPPLTQTVERVVPAALPSTGFAYAPPAGSVEPGLIDSLGGWTTLALYGWLAGALVMFGGGLLLYRWQRREVLRDSVQLAKLGTIRLVSSPAVRGPIAFGILDRVIALPIDFEDRFDAHERRLAFGHELAHHRSGDLVVSHVAFALLCLQWFNPLAWLSHAAFRFDQEAACDARVLDKANGGERADYAQAIAKAASGRALLFAGALDRPRTLNRRLASMLTSTSAGRRLAGKAMIALAAAVALPLTASRATEYVDVPAPAQPHGGATGSATAADVPAMAPFAAAATASTATPAPAAPPNVSIRENADGTITLSGNVRVDRNSTAFFDDDTVLINGKHKTLEQLTPAERSKMRAAILDSQQDLVRERARLPRELAEAKREADRARSGELRREHEQDIADMRRDLAELDSRAAEMRADGDDPVKEKARLMRDLHEAEAEDISREEREAIEEDNPARRTAELRAEEEQMKRMLRRLDQLDRQ